MMRSVLAFAGVMGMMTGLVAGQDCRQGDWFDGRGCQTCTVCRPDQNVEAACASTSNTVCGTPTEQEATAGDGERCTPWENGAVRCGDGLQCVATWNNEGEGSHNPPVCYPSDTMFTESVHDPPTCQQNEDCAATFWCNTDAQPPSCQTILRTDPQTCESATDCPTDAGEGCGYDCVGGECVMWVRWPQPCPQWARVCTSAVISISASTHHCCVAIAVAAPAGSVPVDTKAPEAWITLRAAISPP